MYMTLTKQEKELLDAVVEVKYGEIFGVELDPGKPEIEVEASQNFRSLIEAIRDGLNHISVLTIHQGDPAMAETDFKHKGFSCRKKYRFPTTI
jgi:hypothetical protein